MFLILLIIQQTPLSYQKRPNLKCSPISYLLSFVVWAVFNFVSSGTVVTCFLSLSLLLPTSSSSYEKNCKLVKIKLIVTVTLRRRCYTRNLQVVVACL